MRKLFPLVPFFLSLFFFSAAPMAGARAVWIDTDLSLGSPVREVDDGYALLLAARSPELKIIGLSTTYGNAPLAWTTRRTADSLGAFGLNLKINPGAASPRDLGRSTAATDALAAVLRKRKLTYLALGPLTDLATFLRLHPEQAQRIEQVIVAGSADAKGRTGFGPNNWFRIGDANFSKDPAAALLVLRSRIPLLFVPLRVSSQLRIDRADLRELERSDSAAQYLARKSEAWLWFWTDFVRAKGGPIFDAVAIVAAAQPKLLTIERRRVGDRVALFCTGLSGAAKPLVLRRLSGRGEKSSPRPPAR
jgi:pyrimidine-specific ribonucleoside hydrolase